MKARDIMMTDIHTVSPEATIAASIKIMVGCRVRASLWPMVGIRWSAF